MGRQVLRKTLVLGFALSFNLGAQAKCLTSISDVPEGWNLKSLETEWQESRASDGKPLTIELSARGNQILASIRKSGEGLWADGIAEICPGRGGNHSLRLSRVRVTSAAPNLIAQKLSSGEAVMGLKFSSNYRSLQLTIPGPLMLSWSGQFHVL